jgi:hypothetical protein
VVIGEVEVPLQQFLTSAIDKFEGLAASSSGRITVGSTKPPPIHRENRTLSFQYMRGGLGYNTSPNLLKKESWSTQ